MTIQSQPRLNLTRINRQRSLRILVATSSVRVAVVVAVVVVVVTVVVVVLTTIHTSCSREEREEVSQRSTGDDEARATRRREMVRMTYEKWKHQTREHDENDQQEGS